MPEETVRLRNRRQQPVELHLPSGVLVLPPGGEAQVARSVLAAPQVALLIARHALDTAPQPEAAAPDAAAAPGRSRAAGTDRRVARPRSGSTRRGRRAP